MRIFSLFSPPPLDPRSILAGYKLACGNSPETEALVRARLDAIFLTILARKKREEFDQRGSNNSDSSYKSVHSQFEKVRQALVDLGDKKYEVTGRMDYSLWYGKPKLLETNLIVVEAKAVGRIKSDQALGRWQWFIMHERLRVEAIPPCTGSR